MKGMYENKKNTWSLFIGHLVIVKLLKGLYAKNNEESHYAIKSHNLLQLAEKWNLELTDEQMKKLQIITQIEPHPITTEDFKNIANPFVKEVIDTGIKVA